MRIGAAVTLDPPQGRLMNARKSWRIGCCLAAALAASSSLAAKGGTNVLHISMRTPFAVPATDPPEPDAAGSLSLKLRQQGRADVQKLRLELSGLAAGSAYELWVLARGALAATPVETGFEADESGEASLKLMHLGHGNGKKIFPTGLGSLNDLAAIQVRDGDGVAVVLEADLLDPAWLQYLVKRHLDMDEQLDGDAEGSLFMKEHGSKALFRLRVANLDPAANYALGFNCTDAAALSCEFVEQPLTPDADGRLEVDSLPAGAPLPFDITDLSLVLVSLSGNQVVLETTLP
jgi:hypothetical protein